MKELPAESVHMVLVDPPYGVSFKSNMGEEGFQKEPIANDGFDEWLGLLPRWLKGFDRVLCDGGILAMFCGVGGGSMGKQVMPLAHAVREVESVFGTVDSTLVWDRCDMGLGWRYRPVWEGIIMAHKGAKPRAWNGEANQTNILRYPRIIPKAGEHPTPKPLPLMGHLIKDNTDQGDIVLDAFCGGGPTLEAAELLHRQWIGFDIEQKYVQMSRDRMRSYTEQPRMF
jgi:DNA modification methylase